METSKKENLAHELIDPFQKKILKQLSKVIDPEIGINIVDLGLIYDIKISDDICTIVMTLTIMGCPLSDLLSNDIVKEVTAVKEINICNIKLVWQPAWNINMISKPARLALGF